MKAGLAAAFPTVTSRVRVGTDRDWADISAGDRLAVALKCDGSV